MFVELVLWLGVTVLALLVFSRKTIVWFLDIQKLRKSVKGPTLREIIANSRKERKIEYIKPSCHTFFNDFPGVLPFLYECSKKYGPRFSMWLSKDLFVFITDPNDAKVVLSSQELLYKSNNYSLVANWLGDGLLIAGGSKWQRARKFLTPAFHFNVLKQFKGAMTDCNKILIEKLESQCTGEPINIYPFITLFALDVICETALGVTKNAQLNSTSDYVSAVQG